jgi:peptide/nickel transport system substrate-binding protein
MLLLFVSAALVLAGGQKDTGDGDGGTTEAAATPMPTGTPTEYNEAPMLAEMVAAGELPPVDERISEDPMVITPTEEIGQYGGTWRRICKSVADTTFGSRFGYDPIVRWDVTGTKVVPGVAKSWEVSDDGKVFTFFLRRGLKWSDGVPFTADDIMFYFEDMLGNEDLSPSFPSWLVVGEQPVQVEKIDDYTVRFEFAQSYGLFLDTATQRGDFWYPKHYMQQFHPNYTAQSKLDQMASDAKYEFWYQLFQNKQDVRYNNELPTIRGWKLVSDTTGSVTKILYERNPYFWKVDVAGNQLPYIDQIDFTMVESDEVATLKAVTGEIDMQMRHMSFSDYTVFMKNREQENYRVLNWKTGESGATVFPNQTIMGDDVLLELMRNPEFRGALSMAINREEVNELIYLGMADPVSSVLLPDGETADDYDFMEYYTYDVDRANEILDDLGLEWDSDGKYRLRPDGKVLSITIEGYGAFPTLIDSFDLVRSHWAEIGVNASVKPLSNDIWWPRMYSSEYQAAGYLMTRAGWLTYPRDYTPVDRSTYWSTRYGLWYVTGGEDGEEPTGDVRRAQELYDLIKMETDPVKKQEYADEILVLGAKNVWSIPTVGLYPQPVIVKNNFRNVPETGIWSWPLRAPGYTNIEQYFFKQ